MLEYKTKKSLYGTRTIRSITQTMPPIVCKSFIDIREDEAETSQRKFKTIKRRYCFRSAETVIDRIISKLKRNYKPQDILVMITPASRHANLYKLHVIQRHKQEHLGMTSITHKELLRLKASKAFNKYCIVFGSHFINLKTMVLQSETIKGLVNTLNKQICEESQAKQLTPKNSVTFSKSKTSSAGDYFNNEAVRTTKLQDSFTQTDPEITDNIALSFNDIFALMENINHALEPCKNDIDRFFSLADKLKFSLVIRPKLMWNTSTAVEKFQENSVYFHVESYLPGNCYLGCITLLENDILQQLDLYPKLLINTHVIEDVYDITPLPKMLVYILRKIFGFLKMELLYDALGELIFDWYKKFCKIYL